MPVAEGESAVVQFMVRALGGIFPNASVGACLVAEVPLSGSHVPRRENVARAAEQRIFKYSPDGADDTSFGLDPTRLFPRYLHECVLDVEAGSTLHVASDDARLDDDGSPMMRVVRRAALTLGRGLELARDHAKATADARDLRALHSHMVQTEKLASLGQIAAGIVHELNNPLTSIVAYTDWLTRKLGPTGDPDSIERLRRIAESASRILRFTRDLVAYARPSSEVPVPISIPLVIEQALAFCEHVIAQHGAKVERRFSDGLPAVRGMHEQLVQVFVNLFTNACHAMPAEGGRLTVTTAISADGREVHVSITDNGHGIADDHVAHIFAPFFTTKVDGQGTGLGLSIVKNIMDNHGASIQASRADDGGAQFVLAFPIA
jgi:C4-dicarboxylate-specific signal transduction histidine kinase